MVSIRKPVDILVNLAVEKKPAAMHHLSWNPPLAKEKSH